MDYFNFILLGSGSSRRFGENKLDCLWQGKPLYQHALLRLFEARTQLEATSTDSGRLLCRIIFVSREQEKLNWAEKNCQAVVVHNPIAEEGISSSIRLGLERVRTLEVNIAEEARKADIFFVCDQPNLRTETIVSFLHSCRRNWPPLSTLAAGAFWGNPCWFDQRFRPELLALQGDVGGKKIIHNHVDLLDLFPVEMSELLDVDTQEDWNNML